MTHESLEYAAQYVLAELPFFLNANPIINTQETLMAYHAPWELGTSIINDKFNLKMNEKQGYIILTDRGIIMLKVSKKYFRQRIRSKSYFLLQIFTRKRSSSL